MYLRSALVATINDPRYNGIVMPGDRGHRRSWRFDDPSMRAPDLADNPYQLQDQWSIETGAWTMRHYRDLRCMAPAPDYTELKDNTLLTVKTPSGEWAAVAGGSNPANYSGLWAERRPTPLIGIGGKTWLFWYDSRGMYDATRAWMGEVYYAKGGGLPGTNWLYNDFSFLFQAYRFFPEPTFKPDHYTYLAITLIQSDVLGRRMNWNITIPGPNPANEKRGLHLGLKRGDPALSQEWETVQRFDTQKPEADSNGVMAEVLQFETINGCFLLTLNGETFIYRVPEDQKLKPDIDPNFTSPTVQESIAHVTVYGHAAMFNLSRLDFPGVGIPAQTDLRYTYPLDPTIFNVTDADQVGTVSAWKPEGTAVTCTGVSEHEEAGTGCILFRPRIQCTAANPWQRSAVYVATVDWPPTISAGTTSGQYTTEGQNVLVSANGTINEDWRQSTCDLTLEMDAADVAAIATWKGNNRVQVTAGWQREISIQSAVQFTGYLRQRAHALDSDRPGRVTVNLPCSDGFFRLEKKYWNDLGNFEGSTVSELFHRALNQGGVPDSYISVESDVADLKLTRAVFGAEPRFDFREDTSVPDGLNRLLFSLGCKWGVNQLGVWFVWRPTEYIEGTSTVAFTVDDDTTNEMYTIFGLQSETQFDELEDGRPFVNYVLVRTERGGEEQVCEVWDYDASSASRSLSHHVSSDPNFIGDDWWHVMVNEDAQSAYDLANRIIRDRAGDREGGRVANRRQTISFNADHQPALLPGDYVRVQVTGIPAATDSIFQIVSKDWACSGGDRLFTAKYTARFVQ